MTKLIAILVALLTDHFLVELPAVLHPVVWMGNWIKWSSALACRIPQKRHAARFSAGMALVLIGITLFTLPVWFLSRTMDSLPFWIVGIFTGLLLKPVFALHGLIQAAQEIRNALAIENIPEARRLLGWHLVSRNTDLLDAAHIASGTIESVAENLTDSVAVPLLCFAIGGLPLAWVWRLVNTADAMIGYHSKEWEHIGKFAAIADDILAFLPARLTGMLICIAAALIGADWQTAWRNMVTEHAATESPNAGWSMSAMSGALGIWLEKHGCYRLNDHGLAPSITAVDLSCQVVVCGAYLLAVCASGIGWIQDVFL